MYTLLDGRIDCAVTEKMDGTTEYYDTLTELNVPTVLSGKVTAAMHYAAQGEFKAKNTAAFGREAHKKAVESEAYSVVVDTKGTLLWHSNKVDGNPLICVLSGQTTQEYLNYLDENGISWIVTGKEKIDLARAVEILAEQFNVKRLGVVGGGHINASFLDAGLLDEISIILGAGIDGRAGMAAAFDGLPQDREPFKMILTNIKQYDCSAVWLRYKVIK